MNLMSAMDLGGGLVLTGTSVNLLVVSMRKTALAFA